MVLVPSGHGSMVIHRHGGGRRASHAAHTSRHCSRSGVGFRALGPQGSSGDARGSHTRWTPVTAVTSCVRRKACTLFRASGAGGEGGAQALSRRGGLGSPPGPSPGPRGSRRRGGAGGCLGDLDRGPALYGGHPWSLRGGADRCGLAQPRGTCVAGGRAGHQVGFLGNASHTTAYVRSAWCSHTPGWSGGGGWAFRRRLPKIS